MLTCVPCAAGRQLPTHAGKNRCTLTGRCCRRCSQCLNADASQSGVVGTEEVPRVGCSPGIYAQEATGLHADTMSKPAEEALPTQLVGSGKAVHGD